MKNVILIICILFAQYGVSQEKFSSIKISYHKKNSVFLSKDQLDKVDQLISIMKTDSTNSYELIITNDFMINYESEYKIDKKRLRKVVKYMAKKGVPSNQIIFDMNHVEIVNGATEEQIQYLEKMTKQNKNYLHITKLLVYRRLLRVK